jgi:hypothetical protein
MVELRWRDIVQLIVGACVLAIPVAYTEEVWVLGEQLPIVNVVGIAAASLIFMSDQLVCQRRSAGLAISSYSSEGEPDAIMLSAQLHSSGIGNSVRLSGMLAWGTSHEDRFGTQPASACVVKAANSER